MGVLMGPGGPGANNQSLMQTFGQKYNCIPDNFQSLDQVQGALRKAGLESSSLLVGIDFTKSNEWTGKYTFQGRSLHALGGGISNPYEQAISIIGRTLAAFDDDNLIPCFGFGDATTHDQSCFSFFPDGRPCRGFEEALDRYRTIAPHVRLAGPTSFAPVIEQAVRAVEQSGGQYHVLVIVADGQVTRSEDIPPGQYSPQEKATMDAIVAASNYALSIVLVGVGDGPWDMMYQFDNAIPARNFDNFQFVEFTRFLATAPPAGLEAQVALATLMEIPEQYRLCLRQGLLGRRTGRMPATPARPPPPSVPDGPAPGSQSYQGYQQPAPPGPSQRAQAPPGGSYQGYQSSAAPSGSPYQGYQSSAAPSGSPYQGYQQPPPPSPYQPAKAAPGGPYQDYPPSAAPGGAPYQGSGPYQPAKAPSGGPHQDYPPSAAPGGSPYQGYQQPPPPGPYQPAKASPGGPYQGYQPSAPPAYDQYGRPPT